MVIVFVGITVGIVYLLVVSTAASQMILITLLWVILGITLVIVGVQMLLKIRHCKVLVRLVFVVI
jgi:hypothetical protein